LAGIFISFEGLEGAGKSTQYKKLCSYLEKKKVKFVSSNEPGGSEIGNSIKTILINNKFNNMQSKTELFLFSAARYQHVCEVIKPSLANGYMVITDRYVDSTIAYQAYGRGLDLDLIKNINRIATDGVYPDLTFLLDICPKKSIERLLKRVAITQKKLDRIEEEKIEFFQKVREGYLALAKAEPGRFKIIDAEEDIDKIHNKIIKYLTELLRNNNGI
jgi:dTMP kinase